MSPVLVRRGRLSAYCSSGTLIQRSSRIERVSSSPSASTTYGWSRTVTSLAGSPRRGAVLSTTERLDVGIGNLPAVVRNPVFAAMELATLAGIYPGRLIAGIQVGVLPT